MPSNGRCGKEKKGGGGPAAPALGAPRGGPTPTRRRAPHPLQASKTDPDQPPLASLLLPADTTATVDALVVGAGPAGLALAAALAARGLTVTLASRDEPFVNTYGVWTDEFEALGLAHTLEATWPTARCHFGEGPPTVVARGYGRVNRAALRAALVQRCADAGVRFVEGELDTAGVADSASPSTPLTATLADGTPLTARMVTLACGAAAGRLLSYPADRPRVAAQTAYGVEADVDGWGGAHEADAMLFMDFRRHHAGLAPGTAASLTPANHPAGGQGLWGTGAEAPSFLYAMPAADGEGGGGGEGGAPPPRAGRRRVFLEETCLVARPPLPFAVLQRRLARRLAAAGVSVAAVVDEEWSYIPVGGPLPLSSNPLTAFGAAAGMVHPATGYSVARSLAAADAVADAVAAALASGAPPAAVSAAYWRALWPPDARRAAAFHVFGMELLARLDPGDTNAFFTAFFALPPALWRGFLASTLSPLGLLGFALATFVAAPARVRAALVAHMARDASGRALLAAYLRGGDE